MNQTEFFTEVCNRMSWPPTELSLRVLNRWAEMEYPDRDGDGMTELFEQGWNPLATTWISDDAPRSTRDIGFGPGKWNDANGGRGVGLYASPEAGIRATVGTLAQSSYYSKIREAFREQRYVEGLEQDFQTWIGSPGYSRELAEFFKAAALEQEAGVTRTEYEDMVLAVFAGSEEHDDEGEVVSRSERLRRAMFRMSERAEGRGSSTNDMAVSAWIGVRDHIANHAAGLNGTVPEHEHVAGGVKR